MFTGLFKMNAKCPECQFEYEREPGYFLGATSFSYIFGFIAIAPLFFFLLARDVSLPVVIAMPSGLLVLLSPMLFKYSRLVWLHMDHRFQPPTAHE